MVCQTFLFLLSIFRNPVSVPGCFLEDAKKVVPRIWGEQPVKAKTPPRERNRLDESEKEGEG